MPADNYRDIGIDKLIESDRKQISDLVNKYVADSEILKKNKEEINHAILSFKTFNSLKVGFPEAYDLIPKEMIEQKTSNLPMKNIDHLKTWIKS